MKRSVYTAMAVVSAPKSDNASSAAQTQPSMRAYYIFLARRGTSAHTDRIAHWFGPFATMEQARMIRISAFSLDLAIEDAIDCVQKTDEAKELPWQQLASV